MSDAEKARLSRLRLLYSLNDFQLALSASAFLMECDHDKPISKIERRRFKCFETTMIVSYVRPFSQSHGEVPKLTLEMCGPPLKPDLRVMHDRICRLRNKVFAHSDADLMRMVVEPFDVDLGGDKKMTFFQAVFDEGIEFLGTDLWKVNELFHTIYSGVFRRLVDEANVNPEDFRFSKDFLEQKLSDE